MKKVWIIGKGEGKEFVPDVIPEGIDVWGVNNSVFDRQMDLLFYLHYPEDTAEYREIRLEGNEKGIEVITQNGDLEGWDKQIAYPLRGIIEKFGTGYFGNSIGYMIAYALYKGYEQIDIYGCPISTETEYIFEKANIDFWIGYCMGQGVKVKIHGISTIMIPNGNIIYGWNKELEEVIPKWTDLTKKKGLLEFIDDNDYDDSDE